jgi:hypothetical protein
MNLYQKMIEVRKRVPYLQKDGQISFGRSSYNVITHDYVVGKYAVPCNELGIFVEADMIECETHKDGNMHWARICIQVTFVNADEPSEKICSRSWAESSDMQDKAIGKAYSMAFKYALLKNFLAETGDIEEERVVEETISHDEAIGFLDRLGRMDKKENAFIAYFNHVAGTKYKHITDVKVSHSKLIDQTIAKAEKLYNESLDSVA